MEFGTSLLQALTSWDWAFIGKTILGAGLGSAAVQALAGVLRDRRERADRAGYMAMRLAVQLERFASDCADLILKNKEAPHPPDREFPDWDIHLPAIGDYPSDAEGWKSIDRRLAGKALDLPNRIMGSQSIIFSVAQYSEHDLCDETTIQAGDRAAEALEIAKGLRTKHNVRTEVPVWDYESTLSTERAEVLQAREEERARQVEFTRKVAEGVNETGWGPS
jgi:hypothetical protein